MDDGRLFSEVIRSKAPYWQFTSNPPSDDAGRFESELGADQRGRRRAQARRARVAKAQS